MVMLSQRPSFGAAHSGGFGGRQFAHLNILHPERWSPAKKCAFILFDQATYFALRKQTPRPCLSGSCRQLPSPFSTFPSLHSHPSAVSSWSTWYGSPWNSPSNLLADPEGEYMSIYCPGPMPYTAKGPSMLTCRARGGNPLFFKRLAHSLWPI
jgi:hypothetical protein